MSFFWPCATNAAPGFAARLARLLHWASLLLAVGVFALMQTGGATGQGLLAAAIVYFAGRGLRYLLAGE